MRKSYWYLSLLLIVFLALSCSSGGDGGGGTTTTGTATLAWNAPTTNIDGSPLTDLAGYKIYYGTASGAHPQSIDVGKVTTYQVTNLAAGTTYYFVVTAYDQAGAESDPSSEGSKAIN